MKILFLGASNTDCGHNFTSDNLGTGYVKYLAEKFAHVSGTFSLPPFLINGGSDGFTFTRIFGKWQQQYADFSYDMIILMGGINEVGILQNTGLDPQASIQFLNDTKEKLRLLLSSLLNTTAKYILICEPFLFRNPEYLILWMDDLNRIRSLILDVIKETDDSRIHFIQTQNALDRACLQYGSPAISSDGIHLTDIGHTILGELLFKKICDIMQPVYSI